MSPLLAIGYSILEVLEGSREGLDRLHPLLDERGRLIEEYTSHSQATPELLEQDRLITQRGLSVLAQLRHARRWQSEVERPKATFCDQRS